MFSIARLKRHDLVLLLLTIPLILIGLANVFATTFYPDRTPSSDFIQQLVFVAIGALLFYLPISIFQVEYLNQFKTQLALFAVITALLLLALLGSDPSLGPTRWIRIGQFSFQPSEFAKLFVIVSTAVTFTESLQLRLPQLLNIYNPQTESKIKQALQSPLVIKVAINFLLISSLVGLILIQPSLGNAVLTFCLWLVIIASLLPNPVHASSYLGILLIGLNIPLQVLSFRGINNLDLNHINMDIPLLIVSIALSVGVALSLKLNNLLVILMLGLGISLGVGSGLIWQYGLTEYQQDRFVAFLSPESDPQGAGWQVAQAKVAIASGQIFGKGYLQGTQSNSGLLPYAYTDFAYAAFTEQFGLVGAFVLFLLYLALIFRVLWIGQNQSDNFGRLICVGVAGMLVLNIVVNIGMNLGLLPVTGVPLPLVSYGGSAVLVNLIGLGLVQMINSNRKLNLEAPKIWQLNYPQNKYNN